MKPTHFLLAAAVAASLGGLLSGCAAVQVDTTKATPFDGYRRYAWVKPDIQTNQDRNPLLNSPLITARVEQAVDQAMQERGVTRDEKNPDFYLCYHEYVAKETRTVANPPAPGYFGYRPYSAVWYGGRLVPISYSYWAQPWNTGYHTEHYEDGTLVLDVIDARSNQLLWRGSVEKPVSDPAGLSQQMAREARDIVRKFPAAKPN
jgi:Domain of unknown function (DUF4136)